MLSQIVHITDALIILENAYPGGLKNIILDVLVMVVKYLMVLPPHDISQLKPQLFIKVGATLLSADGVSCRFVPVYLGPSPEMFHGHTICQSKSTRIYIQPPSQLLTL